MTKLSELTTMRVGGTPSQLLVANNYSDLVTYANQIWDETDNWLILGGGSNVVASDNLQGLSVLQVNTKGIEFSGTTAKVQAGENWHDFVMLANSKGLAGIQSLAGIPGSVGAAPMQNIGAYGQEVADVISSVEFLDYESREVIVIGKDFCNFGYRDSIFKQGKRGVILSVEFEFGSAESSALQATAESVLEQRKAKGMVLDAADHDSWSCGSFFTNPFVTPSFARTLPLDMPQWESGELVKLSAAWLIEQSGIKKGFSLPGSKAAVSAKHALAITNRGGATSEEIVELASFIQTKVGNQFGIYLVPEPVLVGF